MWLDGIDPGRRRRDRSWTASGSGRRVDEESTEVEPGRVLWRMAPETTEEETAATWGEEGGGGVAGRGGG
jgi:hypothetical protein